MKYFIEIDGHEVEVDLEASGDKIDVLVEGERFRANCERVGQKSSERYSLLLDGRSRDVAVDGAGSRLNLVYSGRRFEIRVEGEREKAAREIAAAKTPEGEIEIKSQMPGIVSQVLVEPGAEVGPGETLLILEAMKMENEISSEAGGKILRVRVTQGQTVEGGQSLCTIQVG